jgi:hypothetical protein
VIDPRRTPQVARIVLLDDASPSDGEFWTDPTHAPPHYSIGEVSLFFLGYGRRWLAEVVDQHATMAHHGFVYRGQRKFRLYDIERTVHALTEAELLSPHRARLALLHVRLVAVQYGFLTL